MLSQSILSYKKKAEAKEERFSTGIPTIDGNGGVRRVLEIQDVVYPYRIASGKTVLALSVMKHHVDTTGKPALYIDLGQGLNKKTLKLYGIDASNLLVTSDSRMEDISDLIPCLSSVVVDSLATTDNVMEIIRCTSYSSIPLIMVGQLRYFIGGSYVANGYKYRRVPRTTITLSSIESIRKSTVTIGRKVRLNVGDYEFPMLFYFDNGFDIEADLVRYLLEKKEIVRKGSWLYYNDVLVGRGLRITDENVRKEFLSRIASWFTS